jgi:hypothetical protein
MSINGWIWRCNLVVRILEMILTKQFCREIGLKLIGGGVTSDLGDQDVVRSVYSSWYKVLSQT